MEDNIRELEEEEEARRRVSLVHCSIDIPYCSVAEQPLFWAAPAPAPDDSGPGADSGSGSDLLWSAPAPGKKRRLQAAQAPYTKIFHFQLSKS